MYSQGEKSFSATVVTEMAPMWLSGAAMEGDWNSSYNNTKVASVKTGHSWQQGTKRVDDDACSQGRDSCWQWWREERLLVMQIEQEENRGKGWWWLSTKEERGSSFVDKIRGFGGCLKLCSPLQWTSSIDSKSSSSRDRWELGHRHRWQQHW